MWNYTTIKVATMTESPIKFQESCALYKYPMIDSVDNLPSLSLSFDIVDFENRIFVSSKIYSVHNIDSYYMYLVNMGEACQRIIPFCSYHHVTNMEVGERRQSCYGRSRVYSIGNLLG